MTVELAEREASLIDAKPYLPRNSDNPISLAEEVRDELYAQLQSCCEGVGIHAMVAKSPPFSPTVWVRVEIWRRTGQQAQVTGRSWALITITPKPFHRLPQEYTLQYEVCGRGKTIGPVVPLRPDDLRELVLYLSGGTARPALQLDRIRQAPLQFWRFHNKIDRVRTDYLPHVSAYLAFGAVMAGVVRFWWAAGLLALAAAVGFFYLRREPALILSTGRPAQEPRSLIRVDSWQTVLRGLAAQEPQFRAELVTELQASLPAEASLSSEDIWYWGVDGKEERKQIVIAFRRALAFVQLYAYHNDLFIGWDTHVNGGTWTEQSVVSGIDRETGLSVKANSITSGWHIPNEYDVTDVGYLAEWVHAIVVERVKEAVEVHRISQEIDFKIQREERRSVVGRDSGTGGAGARGRLASMFKRTG